MSDFYRTIENKKISDLIELLCFRAASQPDMKGYIFLKDGETEENPLTYHELERKSRAIAVQLQSLGAAGDRALLLYPPGLDYITAFFGCLFAKFAAVPVYPPHPAKLERTLPRLKAIAENARPIVAMTTSKIADMAKLFFADDPVFGKIHWLATDNLQDDAGADWQKPSVSPDTLAFLQYTSGSTGTPKGVMVSHGNLLYNSYLINKHTECSPETRGVIWLPPYHDMGLIGGLLQPLFGGFQVTLMSPTAFLQRPLRWLEAISRYRATASGGPNFAYDLCARKVKPDQIKSLDLSTWKTAFNGAEPIRHDTLERFAAAFKACGFQKKVFYPCYGLAEATLIVSGGKVDEEPVIQTFTKESIARNRAVIAGSENQWDYTLTGCGKTLDNQKIAIVNPHTLKTCDPGELGEIWVSGKSIAMGYWENPEVSKQVFHACPVARTGEKFLRTGDLGFLWKGELFVTGRVKDLLIIRGRNHYPQDIELTAEQSYPYLRPGCIAAFSVEKDNEEKLVIVAEIERRAKKNLRTEEQISIEKEKINISQDDRRQEIQLPVLIPETSDTLDPGKAVNSIRGAVAEKHDIQVYAVILIKVGSIPKTSSGKIQRHACKQGFLSNSLDAVKHSVMEQSLFTKNIVVPDKNMLLSASSQERAAIMETYVRNAVSLIMKTDLSQTDPDLSFNHLGIDSIMAIELQHRLETDLNISWPMTRFLEETGIRKLAEELSETVINTSTSDADKMPENCDTFSGLSFNQKSLWFMYRLAPESSAYNVFYAVKIKSVLNINALKKTFQILTDRHPSLRTNYVIKDNEPVRIVHDKSEPDFKLIHGSHWDDDKLSDYLIELANTPFDLKNGPVLRVNLISRSDNEHILLLNIHHIATDLWSFSVLTDELSRIYPKLRKYNDTQLDDIGPDILPLGPRTYSDYAHWQADMLAGHEGERLWAYWKQQLSGELPVLDLPTDYPRPRVQTYKGKNLNFSLSRELTLKIKKLAKDSNATLYMLLMAAFQVLLFRYTHQDDILVGSPSAGRSKSDFEGIIGYFVNPLVIRSQLTGNMVFSEFLSRVRQTVLEALNHQDYPFQLLVEKLHPKRDPAYSPLFQAMFVLQKPYRVESMTPIAVNQSGSTIKLGELEAESTVLPHHVAQFDLSLVMAEVDQVLHGSFDYNIDLFKEDTVARVAGHFNTLLEGIAAEPEQELSTIPLMDKTELRRVIIEWNNTHADYPHDKTIVQLFEEQAERKSEAVSLVSSIKINDHFEDTCFTYRELNEKANQIAHFLREEHNIRPDDRVGVLLNRSEWMIFAIIGILKAGGAYVPIDPAYPEERIQHMIKDSGCKVLLSERSITMIDDIEIKKIDIHSISHRNASNPIHDSSPSNLAYVIYTSGSTGLPKGVLIEHHSLVNLVCGHQQILYKRFGEGMRQALTAPLVFDVSVAQIFVSLFHGNSLYLGTNEILYDPRIFANFLKEKQINFIDITPGLFASMLESREEKALPESIRHVNLGAENLPTYLIKKFYGYEKYRNITLANIYGPTESCVDAIWFQIDSEFSPDYRVPIGKPRPNIQVYILNDSMYPVPIGCFGEIFLSGSGLARGYLNSPELTKEKFINWNIEIENKKFSLPLYRTGDIGRWLADGNIEFMGRNDDQVKIRGYRIELGEIESELLKHPGVKETAVINHKYSQYNNCIAAYVVPKQSFSLRGSKDRIELWPSLGEYPVYDELVYYAMTNDKERNQRYKSAINKLVKEKIVVEIGTGKDAILARFCAEAGAKKVYAIEMDNTAYNEAKICIDNLGLSEKIFLIHGDANNVELPEFADVCLSEIVGTIGGSEGMGVILNKARRFLKTEGIMIPQRVQTKIAAVRLPEDVMNNPAFTEVSAHYTEKIFEQVGYNFDVRLCIRNFPKSEIISDIQIFEDLDFSKNVASEFNNEISFSIIKDSFINGFLLWLNLYPAEEILIDNLDIEYPSWYPVYFPVFDKEIEVSEGDIIRAFCSGKVSDNNINPDYTLKGQLVRKNGYTIEFEYHSFHHEQKFRQIHFYSKLFADGHIKIKSHKQPDIDMNFKKYLKKHLPSYMIPSVFVILENLPLTDSGKIDRKSLPTPESIRQTKTGGAVPHTLAEKNIAEIWKDALNLNAVGIHDNFFDIGGHSLLVIRVQAELEKCFDREIPVVELFKYPTIAALARYLAGDVHEKQTDEEKQAVKNISDRAEKQKQAARHRKDMMKQRRKK